MDMSIPQTRAVVQRVEAPLVTGYSLITWANIYDMLPSGGHLSDLTAWRDLETEADHVAATTAAKAGSVCNMVESLLELLAKGMLESTGRPTTTANIVTASLLSHNLSGLRCSYLLARQGYYIHATSLLRVVYENWIAVQFLTLHPDKAKLWLCGSAKTPSHSEMLKGVASVDEDLKPRAKELHQSLCKAAHSTAFSVVPNLDPGSSSVFIGAQYKPDFFRSYAYLACSLAAFTADEIAVVIPPHDPWRAERDSLMAVVSAFMDAENVAAGIDVTAKTTRTDNTRG